MLFFSKSKEISESVSIGDVVSYKCFDWTERGLPIEATIFKIRKDVLWEDIVTTEKLKL